VGYEVWIFHLWFIDINIGTSHTNLNGNMGERGENTTINTYFRDRRLG
jgi:hypothetical protein